jgi:hypothetical protein
MRILRSHRVWANARRRALFEEISRMVELEARKVVRQTGTPDDTPLKGGSKLIARKEVKPLRARTSNLVGHIRHSLHTSYGEGLILAFVIQAAGFALGTQPSDPGSKIAKRKAKQFSAKLASDLIRAGIPGERISQSRPPRPVHLRSMR